MSTDLHVHFDGEGGADTATALPDGVTVERHDTRWVLQDDHGRTIEVSWSKLALLQQMIGLLGGPKEVKRA